LCTYLSTECKQPNELDHQGRYPHQLRFSFSTTALEQDGGDGPTQDCWSGHPKTYTDPYDMKNRDLRRREVDGVAGQSSKAKANDFLYVAF